MISDDSCTTLRIYLMSKNSTLKKWSKWQPLC